MNTKSAYQIHMDALWRAYVEADPDLRRLEREKRAIEHRRARKAYAKKVRREAGQAIIRDLIEGARCAALVALGVAVFVLLLGLA